MPDGNVVGIGGSVDGNAVGSAEGMAHPLGAGAGAAVAVGMGAGRGCGCGCG